MEKIGIYDLYQSFKTTVNTFQGGWYRPQTDFQQKVNDISLALWVKWTNEAEKSQEARDNLIFFLKSKNVLAQQAKANYATVTPPKEYARWATMGIIEANGKTYPSLEVDNGKCDGLNWDQAEVDEKYYASIVEREVQLIDKIRWDSCLVHPTKKPTLENPKSVQVDEIFRVAPRSVSVVVLSYYINPEPAIFAYTLAPGDRQTGAGAQIIFDKDKSKDLPWPLTVKNEFIIRLGEAYGLFTRDQFVARFSTEQKMTA